MVKEDPWVIARGTTLFRRKKTNGIPQASEGVELEISAQKKAKTRTTKKTTVNYRTNKTLCRMYERKWFST